MAPSPSDHSTPPPWGATHHRFRIAGLGIGAIIAILLAILLVLGIITWIIYTQLRARRLGLPAPGWRTYVPFMKSNPRSAPTSYEPSRGAAPGMFSKIFGSKSGYSGANTRSARTRAMGEEEWSTRMGDDEETELGLHRRSESYTGYGYGHYGEPAREGLREPEEEPRGRSREGKPLGGTTPFERDVAGLRAISPREMEDFKGEGLRGGRPSGESERRSAFRESIT